MRILLLFLSLLPIICSGQTSDPDSIALKHKLHKHPFPLTLCGIKVLSSVDSVVKKSLGNGYFNPNVPHGGARNYWDVTNNIQVRYVISVDSKIDDISITKPEYPFYDLQDTRNLQVAKFMNKSLDYKLIGNITLGDNPAKIINQYGKPNKDFYKDGYRIIKYIDDYEVWKEVLFYELTFTFKSNRLIRMEIYNGE